MADQDDEADVELVYVDSIDDINTMRVTKSSALEAMQQGCEVPGCDCQGDILAIHARCHPEAGLWMTLRRGSSGEPRCFIHCRECEAVVAEVVLGEEN